MATSLGSTALIVGQDYLVDSATQQMAIGAYAETADGRGFRYAKIGGTSTVPGKLYVAAAWDSTNQAPVGGLGISANVAIGGTQITLSGSLTITANLLAGGYLVTDVTPGQGYIYKIKSNTAVVATTGCVITLEDPLIVAVTTAASKVVLVKHPYDQVIVSPGTASTGAPVGISVGIITNAQFGWLQTHGTSVILSGVATSISLPGVPVVPSASTAGSVIVATAVLPTIGWAMQLYTATEYQTIFLLID